MQIVPVPLFNKDMTVEAYLFRYQEGNDLFSINQATNIFDGASRSPVLEVLNLVGLDAFALGKPVFVPISHITLLGDLGKQCEVPADKIIFLLEDMPKPESLNLSGVSALCEKGFRFAASSVDAPDDYADLLGMCSYFFLTQHNPKAVAHAKTTADTVRANYPHLQLVATHVASNDLIQSLDKDGYALYESRFLKVPVTQSENKISPLKASNIRLINVVQDENFEFDRVTEIVQGDPSLTISLLRLVNNRIPSMENKIKTIAQAVSMLGQQEVRKWVTTAVTKNLGDDRPNELTRISLVRAKFAENLAPLFGISNMDQGLFLMGLFSVLDIILQVTMERALKMLQVTDLISDALVNKSGLFYPVLNMIVDYEGANWSSVSRHMIVHDLSEDDLNNAYIDALVWYKNLIIEDDKVLEEADEAEREDSPADAPNGTAKAAAEKGSKKAPAKKAKKQVDEAAATKGNEKEPAGKA